MYGHHREPIMRLVVKLRRLAGYGSQAATVSGVALAVTLVLLIFAPALFNLSDVFGVVVAALLVLGLTVWMAGMAVVGLDLDWLEHPGTHSGRMLVSLWFAVAGIFVPLLIAIVIATQAPAGVQQLAICLLGLTAGGFLTFHNVEAIRAGLLRGVLPWLGIVAGVAFLVLWLGSLVGLFPLIALGFFIGTVFYAGWAIWLGRRLRVPATVGAPARA